MRNGKLLLIALVAILFAGCSSDKPVDVVKSYLNSCKSENFDKAIQCFDLNDEMKKEEIEALVAKMKAGYAETSGIDKFEILTEEIDDEAGKANIEAKIIFKDGTEDVENYKLLKNEKGDWKIDLSSK